MAGHNKWSKVKRLKGALDVKKGKIFSRLAREITIAAKTGGGDPDTNYRLRGAMLEARGQNMPNDTIDRALKKGTGELEGQAYEEVLYEGFGPGGVIFLIEAATDNKNRTAANLRNIFTKNHGNLGAAGSAAYLFDHRGEVVTGETKLSEDEVLEIVLDAGAEEISQDSGQFQILTVPTRMNAVGEALRQAGVPVASQKFIYIPQTLTKVTDPLIANQLLKLADALDDDDDTSNVNANYDIPDDLMP